MEHEIDCEIRDWEKTMEHEIDYEIRDWEKTMEHEIDREIRDWEQVDCKFNYRAERQGQWPLKQCFPAKRAARQ
jgi:hypothetical protein